MPNLHADWLPENIWDDVPADSSRSVLTIEALPLKGPFTHWRLYVFNKPGGLELASGLMPVDEQVVRAAIRKARCGTCCRQTPTQQREAAVVEQVDGMVARFKRLADDESPNSTFHFGPSRQIFKQAIALIDDVCHQLAQSQAETFEMRKMLAEAKPYLQSALNDEPCDQQVQANANGLLAAIRAARAEDIRHFAEKGEFPSGGSVLSSHIGDYGRILAWAKRRFGGDVENAAALLREARQYVSDAGSEDDNEVRQHADALVGQIDRFLKTAARGKG